MITAPYNFVPLSDKVFYPDWAEQVSHDVPFEDALCGYLDLCITAQTPLFVRNGHKRSEQEAPASEKSENFKSFSCNPDGDYFIPSTSIKGAIRNVLEIISFGKMCNIADKRYSTRDLHSKKYMEFFRNHEIHCGWMTQVDDTIIITDNGIPGRISHDDIDKLLGTDFCSIMKDSRNLQNDSHRTASYKYKLAQQTYYTNTFSIVPLPADKAKVDNRTFVKQDSNGEKGTLVFTGQPGIRKPKDKFKKGEGKLFEFIFFDRIHQTFTIDARKDDGLYKDFEFIYKDSEDWKFWKKRMQNGDKVPVFFASAGEELLHFGLSYLYKLPFPKRIKDYLFQEHKKDAFDLAECMFGTVRQQTEKSLKGRIMFSHAVCTEGWECEEISPYMNGPKPTFYPFYLQQNGQNGMMTDGNKLVAFKTMLERDAKLKGWKRYPVHKENQWFPIPDGQEENTNPSIPLDAGSKFECRVYFHNLKRLELGALLCALELRKGCVHSIGFAKPFGYGACEINIQNIKADFSINTDELKNEFESFMESQIEGYTKSPQLRELYAMMRLSNEELLKNKDYLNYLPTPKDFAKVKKQNEAKNEYGEYLPNYTELLKKREIASSLPQVVKAKISVLQGPIKMAKLVEGKDLSPKELEITAKVKLKLNDTIEAKPIYTGTKIKKLIFLRKV